MKLEKCPCGGEARLRKYGSNTRWNVLCVGPCLAESGIRESAQAAELAWNRMALAGEMERLIRRWADAPGDPDVLVRDTHALLAKLDREREEAR